MKGFYTQIWIVILLGFTLSSYLPREKTFSEGPIKTLIIDPGHGGKDPGALGTLTYEKHIALSVALLLEEILHEELPNLKVVLTRTKDEFVELHQRASIAKDNHGDFFMSIHCNGLENHSVYGTETFIMGINEGQEDYERVVSENESILFEENYSEMYGGFDPNSPEGIIFFRLLKNAFRRESTFMAQKVQFQYTQRLNRRGRGVKQAPFIVLYLSGMPAILTEMGFISNEVEEKFMSSETGQQYLAYALFRAVRDYNLDFTQY